MSLSNRIDILSTFIVFVLAQAILMCSVGAEEIAHWPFDEGAGNQVINRIGGSSYDVIGDPQWVPGKSGGSLLFDGDGDGLVVANDDALNPNNAVSIAFWIKSAETATNFPAIVRKLDSQSGYKVQKWADTASLSLKVDIAGTSYSGGLAESIPDVFDDQWHHIVWVLDNGIKRGYKNGVLIIDASYQHDTGFANSANIVMMGNGGAGTHVTGQLDDVQIFDHALNEDEVLRLMHAGVSDPTDCENIVLSHSMFTNTLIKPDFEDAEMIFRDPLVERDVDGTGNVVTGGISQYIPLAEFPDQPLLKCGFLDVTRPPFSADPSGNPASASGNTAAITAAMHAARQYMLTTYFPAGNYVVDNRLECAQSLTSQVRIFDVGGMQVEGRVNDRQGACVLMGSTRGYERPTIRLIDNATGYDNPVQLKPLMIIWARDNIDPGVSKPNIGFNNMIVGINFDLGDGNPGAVGIDLDGAQGCGIENVTVIAHGAHAGVSALPGPGLVQDLTVIGGRYGIDTAHEGVSLDVSAFIDNRSISNVPTVVASTFIGQTDAAVRYEQQETLSMVGIKVVVPEGAVGPAIQSGARHPAGSHVAGTMSLVDSTIEFEAEDDQNLAVGADYALYMKNVFVKNTHNIVQTVDGDSLALTQGTLSTDEWFHVQEYAAAVLPLPHHNTGLQWDTPVYLNGVRQSNDYVRLGGVVNPPANLQSRHYLSNAIAWDAYETVNAKLHGVMGDGRTDDSVALQSLINTYEGTPLFLPKGYYRLDQTLELAADSVLLGSARHFTHLFASDDENGDFPDTNYQNDTKQPVMLSDSSLDGTAHIAFLSVYAPHETPGAYPLHWRTGQHSVIRAINVTSRSLDNNFNAATNNPPNAPHVIFSEHGGGRWYGYLRDFRFQTNWPDEPAFRMLKVQNTRQPLSIYSTNPEGQDTGGDAKMEIATAANVRIYGFKDERNNISLLVNDSDNINLFGFGGIPWALNGEVLVDVGNSNGVRFGNMVIRGNAGASGDPTQWNIIRETTTSGSVINTDPQDMPVLYYSGSQIDSDGDGIFDIADNCIDHANLDERDTDADGIGNQCDPDFNNDCVVNFIDFAQLTEQFLSSESELHDLNGDGLVNFIDIGIFSNFFLDAPGPSGLGISCL